MDNREHIHDYSIRAAIDIVGSDNIDEKIVARLKQECGNNADTSDQWLSVQEWEYFAAEVESRYEGHKDLFLKAGKDCRETGVLGSYVILPWFLTSPVILIRNIDIVLADYDRVLKPFISYIGRDRFQITFTSELESLPSYRYLNFIKGYIWSLIELWPCKVDGSESIVSKLQDEWKLTFRWSIDGQYHPRSLDEIMFDPDFFEEFLRVLKSIDLGKRAKLLKLIELSEKLRNLETGRFKRGKQEYSAEIINLKQEYQSAISHVFDGVMKISGSGGILDADEYALSMAGFSTLGKLQEHYQNISGFFHLEHDRGDFFRHTNSLESNSETIIKLESENKKPVEILVLGQAGVNGEDELIVRHIGFKSKMQRDLDRNQQFLEAIFQKNPSGLQIIDSSGWTIRFNPPLTKMFNLDPDKMAGPRGYNIFMDPYVRKIGLAGYLEQALLGEPVSVESLSITPSRDYSSPFCDGLESALVVNLTAYPLTDGKGNVNSIVVSYTDVTESYLVSQQLAQLDKLKSIGTLTSGIAHDFNNILGAIVPNADLIINLSEDNETVRKKATAIKTASKRAAALTQQLVGFARTSQSDKRMLKLNSCVSEAIELIRNAVPRNITIDFEPSHKLPTIFADPLQMQQVLINLIINAGDSQPSGGIIKIKTALEHLRYRTSFGGNIIPSGDYARLSVIDGGTGIPEEIVDRVFDPFFTTKDKGRGTGLGLSVVYGIVKNHKGFINIDTGLDKGTRFDVHLSVDS